MITWDSYFISMTYLVSMKSKDRSTRVGAIIVDSDNNIVSTGYNGIPRGVDDCVCERHEKPIKYSFYEHAERNAIYQASRIGVSCKNCRIYINFNPCVECARAIIQSGIKKVITHKEFNDFLPKDDNWVKSSNLSKQMFIESGVEFIEFSGKIIKIKPILGGKELKL